MTQMWARYVLVMPLLAAYPAAAEGPQRIVSMNLCTDQMALLLAGPDRVASVSFLGADPAESSLAEMTKDIAVNHGLAEEIIAARPDLVLAGRYTTSFAKAMLRRLGYKVVEVDSPDTIAGIHDTFGLVGEAVGEPERAAAMLADMDRRLAAVAALARGRPPRSAIIYDANGFTVGRPGLADEIMTLAGLTNKAPELGIGAYGQVPLESMLAVKPDTIVHLSYRPGVPSISNMSMQHPALRAVLDGAEPLSVPGRLFTCGTPIIAAAAEAMAAALTESGAWR
jgi:iron complex transport system substrate-binding protein